MKTSFISAVLCAFTFTALAAPPSADQVLTEAKAQAAKENKAIFVHFGASWCGWCRKLESWLERPDIKPVFEKYFVPVKLVVQENGPKKALENPGADAVLQRFGGPGGLPYSAFLNNEDKVIVNSNLNGVKGQNIGYPSEPAEVDWFVAMVKKAAPKMSDDDLKTIEASLRNQKK